jgi:hypothetical protein
MSLSSGSVWKSAFGSWRGNECRFVVAARPRCNDDAVCVVSVSWAGAEVSNSKVAIYFFPLMYNRPVIGGFVVAQKGWRWTQWVVLFFAVAAYVPALGMQETYKKTILAKRSKKMGTTPPAAGPSGLAALKFLFNVTFIRPLHMLGTEPIVVAWSLYIGFSFAVVYSFFAAFPYVYSSVYGFDVKQNGLTFLSIAVGSLVGAFHVILVDILQWRKKFVAWKKQGNTGKFAPEHRLYGAMAGSFGLPLGLFWFAWTARPGTHWIVSAIAGVFTAWGNMCIFVRSCTKLISSG